MLRFALTRVAMALPTLLIVAVSVFVLIRLIPGDPASLMLGDLATPASIADLRARIEDLSVIEKALTRLADACPPDAPIDDCPILLHLFAVAYPDASRLGTSASTKE